jgi:MtN3 and saliva related transmembrane protein
MDNFTELTEVFGTVAAIATTASFVPQVLQIFKTGNTEGISLTMYSIFVFGISMWLIYGILLNEPPIIAANSVTLLLSGTILFMKIRHTFPKK